MHNMFSAVSEIVWNSILLLGQNSFNETQTNKQVFKIKDSNAVELKDILVWYLQSEEW